MSRQALTEGPHAPAGQRGALLWSVGGSVVLLALGMVLNRAFDSDVHVFYPGSLIINWIAPFNSYPVLTKISMALLNFLIWVVVIYAAAGVTAIWQRRKSRRPASAGGA